MCERAGILNVTRCHLLQLEHACMHKGWDAGLHLRRWRLRRR